MPPKKHLIGVRLTRTRTPTSLKQYVDPHPTGGGGVRHNDKIKYVKM